VIEVNYKDGWVVGEVIEKWHDANIDPSVVDDVDEGNVNVGKDLHAGSNYSILYANKGKPSSGFQE
jgi:hypothetical protein